MSDKEVKENKYKINDIFRTIRKQIPPHDFEMKDKRRYDSSDRYTEKEEIENGLHEYYEETDSN